MPRLARVVAVGVPHHITQRGNARRFILQDEADRKVYLDLLRANHGTARDSTDRLSSFLPHKGEFVDSTDNTHIGFQHCRDKATRLSNKCVPRPYSHLAAGV
jgi:hypothetical protein